MKRIDWGDFFLTVLMFIIVGTFIWIGVSSFMNARNECLTTAYTISMETKFILGRGCYVNTPEYGWYNLDEYLRLRGIQAIREDR